MDLSWHHYVLIGHSADLFIKGNWKFDLFLKRVYQRLFATNQPPIKMRGFRDIGGYHFPSFPFEGIDRTSSHLYRAVQIYAM